MYMYVQKVQWDITFFSLHLLQSNTKIRAVVFVSRLTSIVAFLISQTAPALEERHGYLLFPLPQLFLDAELLLLTK